MLEKNLDYYMSINYEKLLKHYSNCIEVYFPELGLTVLSGSPSSLSDDIKRAKFKWFSDCLNNDIPIPVPARYLNTSYAIR